MSHSQACQDLFVLNVLKNKRDGYFVEIGSNDPVLINNTYILEKEYNWKGIMVEYDGKFLESYKNIRKNSVYEINDATKINYLDIFKKYNTPLSIDYLQIDLEVENESTIKTLQNMNEQVFDKYKFATVTFEHDIYRGDFFNTRQLSRKIFNDNGYFLVYGDVKNGNNSFEDWYVYPSLVDMNYISKIRSDNSLEWQNIVEILKNTV